MRTMGTASIPARLLAAFELTNQGQHGFPLTSERTNTEANGWLSDVHFTPAAVIEHMKILVTARGISAREAQH